MNYAGYNLGGAFAADRINIAIRCSFEQNSSGFEDRAEMFHSPRWYRSSLIVAVVLALSLREEVSSVTGNIGLAATPLRPLNCDAGRQVWILIM